MLPGSNIRGTTATTRTTTIFIRAQKLHSVDLNTRDKKKLQKKRAQPLN